MSESGQADWVVTASNLTKKYGAHLALDNVQLRIPKGRIVGLIGRNGAGKTTALKSILGLTPSSGDLRVLGLDPFKQRDQLMSDVSYIADVAVLPKWMTVRQTLEYSERCHPKFSRQAAVDSLAKTDIHLKSKVKTLSKGMVTQLHLALVMAIDARFLVLDEPTIGLDVVYRKHFYSTLLNDYFDHSRTILVTTHQVEEIEHILTDVIFIERGKVILADTLDQVAEDYLELHVSKDKLEAARQLGPVTERRDLSGNILLFERRDRQALEQLGEVVAPRLADLFVAKVTGGVQ